MTELFTNIATGILLGAAAAAVVLVISWSIIQLRKE